MVWWVLISRGLANILIGLYFVVSVPGAAPSCSTDPVDYIKGVGVPAGGECSSSLDGVLATSLLCSSRPECKFLFCPGCANISGACNCVYCNAILDLHPQEGGSQNAFYMKTRPFTRVTSREVSIPGGLKAGDFLTMTVNLNDVLVLIFLRTTRGDIAFSMEVNFISRIVTSNSRIDGVDGDKIVNKETNQFQLEKTDSAPVMYVVKETGFKLYLEHELYSEFPLRVDSLSSITTVKLSSPISDSKILSFNNV